MEASSLQRAQIKYANDGTTLVINSLGDWNIETVHHVSKVLNKLTATHKKITVQWDVAHIANVDSAGMMLFIRHYDILIANDCTVKITGIKSEHKKLYQLLRQHVSPPLKTERQFAKPLHNIRIIIIAFIKDIQNFLAFVGENFVQLIYSLLHPRQFRLSAIVKNIEEAGVKAIPIVALTSFLIGVVIAYQGAVQLEKFGANIFIVDMIGVSITRELAPLITAIVVAGRTGSSYTAQIGVMKLTEEIDAMRTMGFDPHRFLVLPRILALMIALPLLIFLADIIGVGAGMLIAHVHLDLSFAEFITRTQSTLAVKHVLIGLCKGPVFAWLIATIGCWRGFQVSISTESIGHYTTTSVVNAIFLVIAVDALFSVIFTELGI